MTIEPGPWFDQRFSLLTGHVAAYNWQKALFEELIAGHIPAALSLPTGAGKTNTIVCWLLALAGQKLHATVTLPRRLVWVVNRRKVVDQTSDLAEQIADTIKGLPATDELRGALDSLSLTGGIAVSTLRGEHEDNREWSDDPARPGIIVGTVDMVGSRLLLSGYGLSPRQRAQDAALLANDVLLVNDEAQISPAFARLIRLIEQMRSKGEIPPVKDFTTMHVSATLDESSRARGVFPFNPESEGPHFQRVYTAKKTLRFREVEKAAVLDTIVGEATKLGEHLRRLVFVQRPRDVKFIAKAIARKTKSKVLTITGTMRGFEREQLVSEPRFQQFLSRTPTLTEPTWLVCTSAAEVGIDISSDIMVMDMDTAEHLTQRLGRVNRFGEVESAVAVLVHEKVALESNPAEYHTLNYLHSLPVQDDGTDVSAKMLFENPAPVEAQGKRPALVTFNERDLVLLSYTSVRHSQVKPDVDALLHGVEGNPPYVEVCWREELPYLLTLNDEQREEWLKSYRVLSHERLRELSYEAIRILGDCEGTALLVESDGWSRTFRIPDDLATGLPRESLLILPLGLAGLSSGMLSNEENGNDISGAGSGTARFRFIADGEKIRGEGREFDEEEFKTFLRQNKLAVKSRVDFEPDSEDSESEPFSLIHVVPKQATTKNNNHVWLDEHLAEVKKNVVDLCARLGIPPDVTEELATAGLMHDAGKEHPNWQRAFNSGKMPARPIAKLRGRKILQKILAGLRHEFVSLFEMTGNGLAKHAVAAHHTWGRPHFPTRGYDPERARPENAAMNLQSMRQFDELQKKYGVYGLAYLEAILRVADAMAGGE
jgi:CRISPR-associated endonuclease/helicase Cas3